MGRSFLKQTAEILRIKQRRKHLKRAMVSLSVIVAMLTSYLLILPAVTMERDPICGQEEHTHTDECYEHCLICGKVEQNDQPETTQRILSCPFAAQQHAGNVIHLHDDNCYDADGNLVCTLPEVKQHVHDGSCYKTETVLICGQTEAGVQTIEESSDPFSDGADAYGSGDNNDYAGDSENGHTHTEECYETKDTLVCGKDEIIPHTHTAECNDENGNLVCGRPEMQEHQHDENCFQTVTTEAVEGHTHTEECYEDVLICDKAEHVHTEECYPQENDENDEETDNINSDDPENPVTEEPGSEENMKEESVVEDKQEGDELPEDDSEDNQEGDEQTEDKPEDNQETDEQTEDVSEESQETEESADETEIPSYLCGKDEHIHGEGCWDEAENLICGLEEHVHDETCLQEEDDLEEMEQPKILAAEGNDYVVQVSYTAEAQIPDGAELKVTELKPGTDEYEEYIEKSVANGSNIVELRFFDISIWMDDKEIEPCASVAVTISVKNTEITEQVEDGKVTHYISGGETEVLDANIKDVGNGEIEVSFEIGSFSVVEIPLPAAVVFGGSHTVEVGRTITINGTESKNLGWKSSDMNIAEVYGTESACEVTGISEGTVTITHYNTKNEKAVETFEVTVVAPEKVLEADGDGYTVTVKGNTKVLNGASLRVEEVDPSYDNDGYYNAMVTDLNAADSQLELSEGSGNAADEFDFFHFYHIWLEKEGVEYQPEGENVNLIVTITYDDGVVGLDKAKSKGVYVGHFGKDFAGNLVEKAISSNGVPSDTDVKAKQIRVNNNSVVFHIKNFSIFPVVTPSKNDSYSDVSSKDEVSTSVPTINPNTYKKADNEWQVCEGEYGKEWNQVESDGYRYSTDSDRSFRIQKNVVPAGIENEFYVYLNIEPTVSWDMQSVFTGASTFICNSNNNGEYEKITSTEEVFAMSAGDFNKIYKNGNVGKLAPTDELAKKVPLYTTNANKQYHCTKLIVTETGKSDGGIIETFDIDMYYYLTTSSQITVYIVLPTNPYVLYKTGCEVVESGNSYILYMPQSDYRHMVEDILTDNNFSALKAKILPTEVIDPMGPNIEFADSLTVTNGSATYDSNTQTITWRDFTQPAVSNISTDFVQNPTTTGDISRDNDYYRINAYQMVYKVRLKTENERYDSGTSTPTNGETTLAFNDRIDEFPIPAVKGTRYQIKIKKIDENGNSLSGAKFELTDSSGVKLNTDVITTDSDGIAVINLELVGEDGKYDGIYILTETEAPPGYQLPEGEKAKTTISIGNRTIYGENWNIVYDNVRSNSDEMLLLKKDTNGVTVTIKNSPEETEVTVTKVWEDEGDKYKIRPSSIEVQLFADGDEYGSKVSITAEKEWTYTWTNLPKCKFDEATNAMKDIVYEVKELEVPGYSSLITGDASKGYLITNTVDDYEIELLKTETGNPNTKLKDAAFNLYTDATHTIFATDSSGNTISTITTDNDGKAVIGKLKPGTYYLVEIKAPDGYNLLTNDVVILIDQNGVSYTQSKPSGSLEPVDGKYIITVENSTGRVLPNTGGTGTLPYTLGGLMLIATALMYGFVSRRRRERRLR